MGYNPGDMLNKPKSQNSWNPFAHQVPYFGQPLWLVMVEAWLFCAAIYFCCEPTAPHALPQRLLLTLCRTVAQTRPWSRSESTDERQPTLS